MKKVLIISASPRKNGNSDLLCDEFAKGAIEAGHEVEKIRLAERKSVSAPAATPVRSSTNASRTTMPTNWWRRCSPPM